MKMPRRMYYDCNTRAASPAPESDPKRAEGWLKGQLGKPFSPCRFLPAMALMSYTMKRMTQAATSSMNAARLGRLRSGQKDAFHSACIGFSERHAEASRHRAPDGFVVPAWEAFMRSAEAALLPKPRMDFLRLPVVRDTMHHSSGGEAMREQLHKVLEVFGPERAAAALLEDTVGSPTLLESKWLTSHNTILHLYHMARYVEATGASLDDLRTVVEWGGGYGNFAKVMARVSPVERTYVIVDLPIFSCLQHAYLKATLGDAAVHMVTESEGVKEGRVNTVPLGLVDRVPQCDLFVSTWALTESAGPAQQHVVQKDWFGASRLLIGGQAHSEDLFPHARDVADLAARSGAMRLPHTFNGDQGVYLFK